MASIDRELVEALEELGLTRYEALAYLAILMSGPSVATEIVKTSGIPQSRIYDVLSGLERKGFIESTGDRPKIYRAHDPEVVLENMRKRFINRIEELKAKLNEIKRAVPERKPSVWVVYRRENIVARIRLLMERAVHECLAALPLSMLADEAMRRVLEEMVSRHVNVVLVLYRDVEDKDLLEGLVKKFRGKLCLKIREVPGPVVCLSDHLQSIITSFKTISWGAERFGAKNHALIATEEDLAHVLSYFLYHSLYYNAVKLCEIVPEFMKGLRFISVWRFTELMKDLLMRGYEVRIRIKGSYIRKRGYVELEGKVVNVNHDDDRRLYDLELEDGTTVGGREATLEDVEAQIIEVVDVKLRKE
ncbi:MAG: hypothetical protein DRN15_01580 [Thermoprotei archaeon]|nr:MAG: hypothetical protein DRN15_01580 [Thermoprotei archaeon]